MQCLDLSTLNSIEDLRFAQLNLPASNLVDTVYTDVTTFLTAAWLPLVTIGPQSGAGAASWNYSFVVDLAAKW